MSPAERRMVVVGGGPAGLMAAEVASQAGVEVDLYEGKGSVGRKFLIAGKGGLNLTHSESAAAFARRYGKAQAWVGTWLDGFDAPALRDWAASLGIETFVGSSGRVFPLDMRAAPLLRAWVRRLRAAGVRFHVNHRCQGWDAEGLLRFATPAGEIRIRATASVLALGGGSWPQLGSDGAWTNWLAAHGAGLTPLRPSNCGFDVGWSSHFSNRFAGQAVKPALVTLADSETPPRRLQGEFVITNTGVEGSLIYALSPQLRDRIGQEGQVRIDLDLAPGRDASRLLHELSQPRKGRSLTEVLRRSAGIRGVQTGLLYECAPRADLDNPAALVRWIKALPIVLLRTRPISEAISSAGGVELTSLDDRLMLTGAPGVFCAGEMLDWEAPTGGYLLAASLASGRTAGAGAVDYLNGIQFG